jgi:hypothetical protein
MTTGPKHIRKSMTHDANETKNNDLKKTRKRASNNNCTAAADLKHASLLWSAAAPAQQAVPVARVFTAATDSPPDIHIIVVRNHLQLIRRVQRISNLTVPVSIEVQVAVCDALEHVSEVWGVVRGKVRGLVHLNEPWLQLPVQHEVESEQGEEALGARRVPVRAAVQVWLEVL